ncbi:MAG TPA: N-(5'-phosphoribosyl)anthranilate isomerase, partial [Usitatibacter sp.]|nr:N-(5'-phosphoribosyl)anthranilate isomerase [Usitatibacter sp.]
MTAERTRIKICGIREEAHARVAYESGADAIGFVFHRPSPRYIDPREAGKIIATLPPFVTAVGLFVNEPGASLDEILTHAPVGMLQFQGDEPPEFCVRFGRPYVRAVRM